ncbi:3-hydroxyacyl-CoA dehydrogenase [Acinetobacter pragensis]|uniref:3-hydroxyacyl-CoA dehydrogenase n=1 Tax=Acinetobacter pragensis TaxID=1806892 RepID=UPI003340746C
MNKEIQKIGVIGAGIMGTGIAQIAIQSQHEVYLFDVQPGAAKQAQAKLQDTFNKLVAKQKITEQQMSEALNNLHIAEEIEALQHCDLIIEAIVEKLEIKQSLMKQLEAIVDESTILASNTSSLSITAIAAECKHPERVAGYHFFNPVPLMKVVEVIQGLRTRPEICNQLIALAQKMGHRPVRTKDTPGFIINHAGRAYGTEALKILSENVTTFSEIDQILKASLGFKMGPFELLDLTGLDVSHPVMESVYNQYYQEPRYRPNVLTQQMLTGKKLGRKTSEGFYRYMDQQKLDPVLSPQYSPIRHQVKRVWLSTEFQSDFTQLSQYLSERLILINHESKPSKNDLILIANYGEDATHAAQRLDVNPEQIVCIDMLGNFDRCRTLMPTLITQRKYIEAALDIFTQAECKAYVIQESLGFVAQRVLAMIVNLACDIAQQNIASVDDINAAVKLGLGYPHGPIEWGDAAGREKILLILERMTAISHDPRYRPSPWLQRRTKLNLSLNTPA